MRKVMIKYLTDNFVTHEHTAMLEVPDDVVDVQEYVEKNEHAWEYCNFEEVISSQQERGPYEIEVQL